MDKVVRESTIFTDETLLPVPRHWRFMVPLQAQHDNPIGTGPRTCRARAYMGVGVSAVPYTCQHNILVVFHVIYFHQLHLL